MLTQGLPRTFSSRETSIIATMPPGVPLRRTTLTGGLGEIRLIFNPNKYNFISAKNAKTNLGVESCFIKFGKD
jgi:hypothetical protein